MTVAIHDVYSAAPQAKDRFMKFVCERPDGCWEWMGWREKDRTARGQFRLGPVKVKAHVASWRIHHGERPRGKEIHHTCLNSACVNPDHMMMLTPPEHRAEHRRLKAEALNV